MAVSVSGRERPPWHRGQARGLHWEALAFALAVLMSAGRGRAASISGPNSTHLDATSAVEVGAGVLSLPGARLCSLRGRPCELGDRALLLRGRALFRPSSSYSLGIGALITSGDRSQWAVNEVERSNLRRYFSLEVVARLHPLRTRTFEPWLGLSGGVIVTKDSFASDTSGPSAPYVGPKSSTLSDEGLTLGLGVGAAWAVSGPAFIELEVGPSLWLLPAERAGNSFGETVSLSGANLAWIATLAFRYELWR